MSEVIAVYCPHTWGDQMAGSDGAFRICKGPCRTTWYDGQPEPRVQIGKIEPIEEAHEG